MSITAYCDGACRKGNPGICAGAFIVYYVKDGKQHLIYEEGFWLGQGTNNHAEYSALRHLLQWLDNWKNVTIYCDSKLVVEQVNGRWRISDQMKHYFNSCYGLFVRGQHQLIHIDGHSGIEGNQRADELCNEVLDDFERRGFGKEYSGTTSATFKETADAEGISNS